MRSFASFNVKRKRSKYWFWEECVCLGEDILAWQNCFSQLQSIQIKVTSQRNYSNDGRACFILLPGHDWHDSVLHFSHINTDGNKHFFLLYYGRICHISIYTKILESWKLHYHPMKVNVEWKILSNISHSQKTGTNECRLTIFGLTQWPKKILFYQRTALLPQWRRVENRGDACKKLQSQLPCLNRKHISSPGKVVWEGKKSCNVWDQQSADQIFDLCDWQGALA